MKPILYTPCESPYLVPYDGSFRVKHAKTAPPKGAPAKKAAYEELAALQERMRELQATLYADDRYSLLLVFQAMDAAGKDGTIRAVMTGVNPAGCQVFSFKAPSHEELDHDFLWRVYKCLPERGRIGIFNRSHYEEVIVVRVHEDLLTRQQLPRDIPRSERIAERYESIRDMERHLARNGTAIVKLWLNVSPEVQRERFLTRIDETQANWKFSARDVDERKHWDDYMHAYEDALNETSRPWAPWYAVPADEKPYMRVTVARIIVETLEAMKVSYPAITERERSEMLRLRDELAKPTS